MNGQGREIAFVTGAGSGIGAAVACRLAARGAAVALFDLAKDKAEATAAVIEAEGGRALPLHGDVGDDGAVERAVAETVVRLGAPSTAVACAGVAITGAVSDISLADWQRALQVNLTGVFLTARHTIPHMVEAGSGAFTAISSDAGVHGAEGFAAYCASKHGVVGLIRCLALDHGPQGVRANAVCPGFVETPMADQIFEGTGPEVRGYYATTVPLGRFARPEEVAEAVAHLTSAEASYTNGMTYVIDGGATAGYFEGGARA